MGLLGDLWRRATGQTPPATPPPTQPVAPTGEAFDPETARRNLETLRDKALRKAAAQKHDPIARGAVPVDPGQYAPVETTDERLAAVAIAERSRASHDANSPAGAIPSADDPDTAAIDAALVARGLASGDELDAWREIEEDANASDHATRQPPARSGGKAARRAATAERFATDIIYLGRDVSSRLNDRVGNPERLKLRGLPNWATPAEVANGLGLDIPTLRWLAFHSDAATQTHYTQFAVPKKSGGLRTLAAPKPKLAAAQRIVLDEIVSKLPVHDDATHGFVAGRSTITAAQPHVGAEVVLNVDLRDFFPTITFPRVRGLLQSIGYSPAAATILALLCTESPRRTVSYDGETLHVAAGPRALPQGACTSPGLSNAICAELDDRLWRYAQTCGWSYTRYADDLTLSGPASVPVAKVLAFVRHLVEGQGFALNPKKTRVLRRSTRQSVTGVVVNEKLSAPRELRRRLRAILHNAQTHGLESQNTIGHDNFAAWVAGQIAYVAMINPEQAAPLREAFERLGVDR